MTLFVMLFAELFKIFTTQMNGLNKSYPSVLRYSLSRTGPSFGANQNAVTIEPIKTINGA
jgi:hypothetical protein